MTIEVRRATIAPHTHHGFYCCSAPDQEIQAPGLLCYRKHPLTNVYVTEVKFVSIRYGVTANIAAFHAAARGSIPRIGVLFFPLRIPLPLTTYPISGGWATEENPYTRVN